MRLGEEGTGRRGEHAEIQFEFRLRERAKDKRPITKDAVEELCGILRDRGWMTSRQITGLRPQWNDRFIRLLASASGNRILSYPGSPGYRLVSQLTGEDAGLLLHAGNALVAQARENMRRGFAYRRMAALQRAALNTEH